MKANDELYCADLDWWLTQRDFECGHRSNFGGFVAMLERGGGGGGVDSSDPYHEAYRSRLPSFDRDRRIAHEWALTPAPSRRMLFAHYAGALVTGGEESYQRWPKGLGPQLGKLCGAAVVVAFDAGELGPLLEACANSAKEGAGEFISDIRNRAEAAVRAAHRDYYQVTEASLDAWVA